MDAVNYILKATPEIALFLALALGCALGQARFRGFNLGGVAGPLIVALSPGTVLAVWVALAP